MSAFNIAKIDSIMVNLDPNVTYLIGMNGQGKSLVGLDIPWIAMQGIAEKSTDGRQPIYGERFRFIGPNGASGLTEIVIHDDLKNHDIRVIRKVTKSGTELSFSAPVGVHIDQAWLNELFNIFLISPNRFINLPGDQQARELGIDTSKWDKELKELKTEYTKLNGEAIKYDKLPSVDVCTETNITELTGEKAMLQKLWNEQYAINQQKNNATRQAYQQMKEIVDRECNHFNNEQTGKANQLLFIRQAIELLLTNLTEDERIDENEGVSIIDHLLSVAQKRKDDIKPAKQAKDHYPPAPTILADMAPDYVPADDELVIINELPPKDAMDAVDQKIITASENNTKAQLYKDYLVKMDEAKVAKQKVADNKQRQEKLVAERIDYLKTMDFPFPGMSVDDNGILLLKEKPLKPQYYSTGELLRIIPVLMASRNPAFKYVFLQEANLIDEKNLPKLVDDLVAKGFQVVVELVGREKLIDKHCILLNRCKEVDQYPIVQGPAGYINEGDNDNEPVQDAEVITLSEVAPVEHNTTVQ